MDSIYYSLEDDETTKPFDTEKTVADPEPSDPPQDPPADPDTPAEPTDPAPQDPPEENEPIKIVDLADLTVERTVQAQQDAEQKSKELGVSVKDLPEKDLIVEASQDLDTASEAVQSVSAVLESLMGYRQTKSIPHRNHVDLAERIFMQQNYLVFGKTAPAWSTENFNSTVRRAGEFDIVCESLMSGIRSFLERIFKLIRDGFHWLMNWIGKFFISDEKEIQRIGDLTASILKVRKQRKNGDQAPLNGDHWINDMVIKERLHRDGHMPIGVDMVREMIRIRLLAQTWRDTTYIVSKKLVTNVAKGCEDMLKNSTVDPRSGLPAFDSTRAKIRIDGPNMTFQEEWDTSNDKDRVNLNLRSNNGTINRLGAIAGKQAAPNCAWFRTNSFLGERRLFIHANIDVIDGRAQTILPEVVLEAFSTWDIESMTDPDKRIVDGYMPYYSDNVLKFTSEACIAAKKELMLANDNRKKLIEVEDLANESIEKITNYMKAMPPTSVQPGTYEYFQFEVLKGSAMALGGITRALNKYVTLTADIVKNATSAWYAYLLKAYEAELTVKP